MDADSVPGELGTNARVEREEFDGVRLPGVPVFAKDFVDFPVVGDDEVVPDLTTGCGGSNDQLLLKGFVQPQAVWELHKLRMKLQGLRHVIKLLIAHEGMFHNLAGNVPGALLEAATHERERALKLLGAPLIQWLPNLLPNLIEMEEGVTIYCWSLPGP